MNNTFQDNLFLIFPTYTSMLIYLIFPLNCVLHQEALEKLNSNSFEQLFIELLLYVETCYTQDNEMVSSLISLISSRT